MDVWDLNGQAQISDERELVARLRSARQGGFGAFILQRDVDGPSLWIHTNCDVAYLHYFPQSGAMASHPGYQARNMTPAVCPPSAKFVLIGGHDADAIEMPCENLVSVDTACIAAAEFLRSPALPASVSWFEL